MTAEPRWCRVSTGNAQATEWGRRRNEDGSKEAHIAVKDCSQRDQRSVIGISTGKLMIVASLLPPKLEWGDTRARMVSSSSRRKGGGEVKNEGSLSSRLLVVSRSREKDS